MPSTDDLLDRPAAHGGSVRDHLALLGSWLRKPMRVASVAPSGRPLARLMTDGIEADTGPVLELGAGTGVFTAELIAKGVPAKMIYAVEMDDRLAELLSDQFPDVNVVQVDASLLSRDGLAMPDSFATAISGLPVLSMSAQDQIRLLTGVFRRLLPGGALYQFTYGPMCPFSALMLARLGLRGQRIGGVVRNLPPASVYRISRRSPPPGIGAHDEDGSERPAA